jgi:hypothetical protein
MTKLQSWSTLPHVMITQRLSHWQLLQHCALHCSTSIYHCAWSQWRALCRLVIDGKCAYALFGLGTRWFEMQGAHAAPHPVGTVDELVLHMVLPVQSLQEFGLKCIRMHWIQ